MNYVNGIIRLHPRMFCTVLGIQALLLILALINSEIKDRKAVGELLWKLPLRIFFGFLSAFACVWVMSFISRPFWGGVAGLLASLICDVLSPV